MRIPGTRFERRLAVFLLSAASGLAVAYDTNVAAARFGFVCGGLLLGGAMARMPSRIAWHGRDLPLLRILLGVTPALIAVSFLLTNDWSEPVDKARWLEPVRHRLAAVDVAAPLPSLHPNVVGGLLAMLLPLQTAALVLRPGRERRPSSIHVTPGRVALLALSVGALLGTRLRGAWAALALAAGLWLIWRAYPWLTRRARMTAGASPWVLAGGLIPLVVLGTAWVPDWAAARPDRLVVWSNSWHLAWDYVFTGVGLGSFTMPYSSYAVLLHVPYLTHAHNLFLDIWLEQGLFGLLAFVWILIAAFVPGSPAVRRPPEAPYDEHATRWRTAAVISLLVIVLHGSIDDVYYGYGGAGALLLFIPVALLSRARTGVPFEVASKSRRSDGPVRAGAAVLLVVAVIQPATRSLYHANMGALLQTRAELSVYRWPKWPVQDGLRRSQDISLDAAVDHYRAALAIDPGNAVANRRLGQIELSRGRYHDARAHLEAAYRAAPGQHATRQMLGESLSLTGDRDGAAELWRTVPLEQDQLAIRRAWYESTGDPVGAGRIREAIARTLTADQ